MIMKTKHFLLYTILWSILYMILIVIGATTSTIAIVDIFKVHVIWSSFVVHNYVVDAFIFVSGIVTAISSLNKLIKTI